VTHCRNLPALFFVKAIEARAGRARVSILSAAGHARGV
jgi:hypothetical protein